MEDKIYTGTICKGSFMLGSACGHCEKCKDEMEKFKEVFELPTKQILKIGDYTKDILDNSPDIKSYDMYQLGWEMDTRFWVLPDGRKFCTNHGSLEEFSDKSFKRYKKRMKEHHKELKEI